LDGKPHIVVFFAFLPLQHFTVFYSILHVGGLDEPFLWSNPLDISFSCKHYHSYFSA